MQVVKAAVIFARLHDKQIPLPRTRRPAQLRRRRPHHKRWILPRAQQHMRCHSRRRRFPMRPRNRHPLFKLHHPAQHLGVFHNFASHRLRRHQLRMIPRNRGRMHHDLRPCRQRPRRFLIPNRRARFPTAYASPPRACDPSPTPALPKFNSICAQPAPPAAPNAHKMHPLPRKRCTRQGR